MQVHENSVSFLKRAVLKPFGWLLVYSTERQHWEVCFRWNDDEDSHKWEWLELRTARGEIKTFKSADAAIQDIWSVHRLAQIELERD